jgi:hypothetical protein
MSNKDLFKEAIADAKAVREAALANAKVALEEALAPKLQSMLSAKLQEMELDEVEEDDKMEEGFYPEDTSNEIQDKYRATGAALEEEELEEDFDLSSILAELELEEKEISEPYTDEEPHMDIKGTEKGYVKEAEEAEAEEEKTEDEESEDEAPEEDDADKADYEAGEGEKITDLTVDELKDIIKDIISAEMGDGDMEMGADDIEAGGEEEMAIDLGSEDEKNAMEEEIDLEELLAELDAMGDQDEENEAMYEAKKKSKKDDDKEDKEEMKEAIATIETLRNELNEVNLLNAKLLYVNKVFKAKNLTESQKLKVIAQFDKANTAKEAKAIFESMNSAIVKSKRSTIKESLGFASKAAGIAPQKPIVDETMSRWQMLAGITKF